MLAHYYAAIRLSNKQNMLLCLGTPETNRWGQPASIDFGDVLTPDSFHASVGDTPL